MVVFPYVDDVLGDLSGFIDVQHVRLLSDHRIQRQAFAEAAQETRRALRKTQRPRRKRPRASAADAPGDDGEVRRHHAGTHEQDDVLVPRLSVVHHLLLEELQVVLVVAVNFQQADRHLAVPAALVHLPPATLRGGGRLSQCQTLFLTTGSSLHLDAHLADELAQLQLLVGDVPLLQVDAGLADVTGDRSSQALDAGVAADGRR